MTTMTLTAPAASRQFALRAFTINLSVLLVCLVARCAAATAWIFASAAAAGAQRPMLALGLGGLAAAHVLLPGPGTRWVQVVSSLLALSVLALI